MPWFRRGRHRLGADVPATPSRPAVPPPAAARPAADDLYGSIASLIASGEAWGAPSAPAQRGAAPAPAVAPLPLTVAVGLEPPPTSPPPPVRTEPYWPAPAVPFVRALSAPPPAEAPPRHLVPEDLVTPCTRTLPPPDELPARRATAETRRVCAPRVSLGFRDGSTAQLEPGSEQAVALEQLAVLLSLRDSAPS